MLDVGSTFRGLRSSQDDMHRESDSHGAWKARPCRSKGEVTVVTVNMVLVLTLTMKKKETGHFHSWVVLLLLRLRSQ